MAKQRAFTVPEIGERALIVGQTGSGKTAFAYNLLLNHKQSPIVIYDAKGEPKFNSLPNSKIVSNIEDCTKWIDEPQEDGRDYDYIIFRPDVLMSSDPKAMDDLLFHHYINFDNVGLYIDELYAFHKNGRHGAGLNAILTRGRSKGISCIMSTQRPAWISLFCLTEAQHMFIFSLSHSDDAKRIDKIHEGFSDFSHLKQFEFWEIPVKPDAVAMRRKPIPLDKIPNAGYVDLNSAISITPNANPQTSIKWI